MPKRKPISKGQTLYIKNPAAHRPAEQVSKKTGGTPSDAVIQAVEDHARKAGRPIDRRKLDALRNRIQAMPVRDGRTPDEILGYNQFGLPQ